MIKYHPTSAVLAQFAEGLLPGSLCAAVSIHVEMCHQCRAQVAKMQTQLAQQCFSAQAPIEDDFEFSINGLDMSEVINAITSDQAIEHEVVDDEVTVLVGPAQYRLPRAIRSMEVGNSLTLGNISRAKIELNEGPVHTHLLYMAPGGEVPPHTHTGFELTLLLEGTFADEMDEYVPGDFIMLDSKHTHSPRSLEGCVCLTVVSDALRFTSGLSRLLNPLGKYLY